MYPNILRSRWPAVFALFAAGIALGAEGKWTPTQVLELDRVWLKKQGLKLPPEQLWDPERGQGLLTAVISTGGCSAAFISQTGLFLTNHHCLFSIVQEHSTPENDLITNGFLAPNQAGELKSRTARVTIPYRFSNITPEIVGGVPPGAGDLARYRAIEAKQKEIVERCEKQSHHRCRVAAFDGGISYELIDTVEIADVRLVYAPPRSVGEFGGEIDNFGWPRHTGDFAIGRAYVSGAPFRPKYYLPVSKSGVKPGDFVMVMGYPGLTFRALTVAEMAERKRLFEKRVDLYGEFIRTIEETTKGKPEGIIAVASNLKSLNNSYKNAQGQLEGLRRGRILDKQEEAERAVMEWARQRSQFSDALAAREGLAKMVDERTDTWERDYLLTTIPQGSKALYLATTIARAALEREKPDAERDSAYMERERPRLKDRLEREQKNYFAPADRALFAVFVRRALALGNTERLAGVNRVFRDRGGIASTLDALYAGTRVLDPHQRARMFEETPAQLRARKDPLLDFAFTIVPDQMALRDGEDRASGIISRLRPVWRRAVIAHAGKPIAPDANSSLRVSFAQVKGYKPRDAVIFQPQTTLGGMLDKYTGAEPFDAPADVLQAARAKDFGPWVDPRLGDVPVDFLSDADTTGGNSGSPTVNGRGELVGVNFDRVWENVANDFGYNPAIARNVNADLRYLLWMLDRVHHGTWLLEELGIVTGGQ
jgi:hypothetical protein